VHALGALFEAAMRPPASPRGSACSGRSACRNPPGAARCVFPASKVLCAEVTQATDYDLLGEVVEENLFGSRAQSLAVASIVHRSSDGRKVTLRTV